MEFVLNHSNEQTRVSHVYRSFTWGDIDYIAMEYIDGSSLDAISWSERTTQERQSIVLQVNEGLRCIRSLRHCEPGPVGQGIPMGRLFTSYGAGKVFQAAVDMEPWFNHKLRICGAGDVIGLFGELVMCHMDLRLRNLVLDEVGKLWFLDWAWAGFPQAFEKASLSHIWPADPDFEFTQDVLRELGSCSSDEPLLGLLMSVYQVNAGPFAGSHIIEGF
jgi:serine/threonine protein kinase